MRARLLADSRGRRVHPNLSEANPSKLSAQEGAAKRGASELSPALQRWEKWKKLIKSRRDDRVLTSALRKWSCLQYRIKKSKGFSRLRSDR